VPGESTKGNFSGMAKKKNGGVYRQHKRETHELGQNRGKNFGLPDMGRRHRRGDVKTDEEAPVHPQCKNETRRRNSNTLEMRGWEKGKGSKNKEEVGPKETGVGKADTSWGGGRFGG